MLVLDISGDLQLPRHHVVNLAQYETLEARVFVMLFLLQGLNQKQFLEMYKRAYPHAFNSKRLANSVFRLCDRNNDGIIDFTEFAASICIPPTRYVFRYIHCTSVLHSCRFLLKQYEYSGRKKSDTCFHSELLSIAILDLVVFSPLKCES